MSFIYFLAVNFSLLTGLFNAMTAEKKQTVEVIVFNYGCDSEGSIDLEAIKDLQNGPCSSRHKLNIPNFYDSIVQYMNGKSLREDSVSKKMYDTNLRMYVSVCSNDKLEYEFAIDYQGYIFFKNRTYYPKELNLLLCRYY